MEKYGVETPDHARRCPRCGETPLRQGAVLLCPIHGSEPFEKASTRGVESTEPGDTNRTT